MDIMEISIMHHVVIVLLMIWLLSSLNFYHPIAYFVFFVYLYLVHDRYIVRLRKKLEFEESRQANQRRVLSDSETVRWLNYAVEKIWPICMENIASQKFLLPIIPWFLEKYKPWTAKKAEVQHLYLGRNAPMFTDIRVLRQSTDDDHLVLELGMNFLTADDMSAIIAVKLRRRLGFGMWAKLHMTGMHVEGKVLVGVKFLPKWPFLGRLRICFAEPPYFQMTVKPIFTHGLDVTEVPGIAGWIDKILSMAFEQTLVEPNMLVVDVEKFASPTDESWFSVYEKEPVAYARVEVIEACDMKPSDLNGFADPYLKGQVGAYRFRTKIQRKTLAPKWYEEFKVPISTWELPNVLVIEVRDKDHFIDDILGNCTVNISDLRDGRRHDIWLPLQNIKTGRLHLAITILEGNGKFVQEADRPCDQETLKPEDRRNSFASETANKSSFSSASSVKSPKSSIVADSFEPINIEGQRETGIWVHHPGSEVSPTWEPRKGKNRLIDTEIQREPNDLLSRINSVAPGSIENESSSSDENADGKNRMNRVRRGLRKIGSVFHRSPRTKDNSSSIVDSSGSIVEAAQSPRANLRAVNAKEISVDFIVEDTVAKAVSGQVAKEEENLSPGGSGAESPGGGNMKNMAKSILKHAEISARSFKHVLIRKGSEKSLDNSLVVTEREISAESDSSDDDSLSSPSVDTIPVVSNPIPRCYANEPVSSKEKIVQADGSEPPTEIGVANSAENLSFDDSLEKIDIENVSTSKKDDDGLVEGSSIPKLSEENVNEVKS